MTEKNLVPRRYNRARRVSNIVGACISFALERRKELSYDQIVAFLDILAAIFPPVAEGDAVRRAEILTNIATMKVHAAHLKERSPAEAEAMLNEAKALHTMTPYQHVVILVIHVRWLIPRGELVRAQEHLVEASEIATRALRETRSPATRENMVLLLNAIDEIRSKLPR